MIGILLVGSLRGAWIGMIRESFSIGAIASGCLALRFANPYASQWLTQVTGGEIGSGAAPWITGAVLVVATAGIVGYIGRWIRRGAQAVGLGWADRLGGGALGAAEGALVATVLIICVTAAMGRDHPSIKNSHSLQVFESVQSYVVANYDGLPDLPQVSAPSGLF